MSVQVEIHQDHRQWESENTFWHDQLRAWQQETELAVANMPRIEQAWQNHLRKLEVHAAAIRLYAQKCADHEKRLADAVRTAAPVAAICCGAGHCTEAYDHAQAREHHESLKRRHHELLAQWAAFLHSIESST